MSGVKITDLVEKMNLNAEIRRRFKPFAKVLCINPC